MYNPTFQTLDQLIKQMSDETELSIYKEGRRNYVEKTPDYRIFHQMCDQDIIHLNFPFLN